MTKSGKIILEFLVLNQKFQCAKFPWPENELIVSHPVNECMPISELHTPLPITNANFFTSISLIRDLPNLCIIYVYVDIGIDVIAKSQAEKQNVSVTSY